jgi:hypothetical protein
VLVVGAGAAAAAVVDGAGGAVVVAGVAWTVGGGWMDAPAWFDDGLGGAAVVGVGTAGWAADLGAATLDESGAWLLVCGRAWWRAERAGAARGVCLVGRPALAEADGGGEGGGGAKPLATERGADDRPIRCPAS